LGLHAQVGCLCVMVLQSWDSKHFKIGSEFVRNWILFHFSVVQMETYKGLVHDGFWFKFGNASHNKTNHTMWTPFENLYLLSLKNCKENTIIGLSKIKLRISFITCKVSMLKIWCKCMMFQKLKICIVKFVFGNRFH